MGGLNDRVEHVADSEDTLDYRKRVPAPASYAGAATARRMAAADSRPNRRCLIRSSG